MTDKVYNKRVRDFADSYAKNFNKKMGEDERLIEAVKAYGVPPDEEPDKMLARAQRTLATKRVRARLAKLGIDLGAAPKPVMHGNQSAPKNTFELTDNDPMNTEEVRKFWSDIIRGDLTYTVGTQKRTADLRLRVQVSAYLAKSLGMFHAEGKGGKGEVLVVGLPDNGRGNGVVDLVQDGKLRLVPALDEDDPEEAEEAPEAAEA